MDRRDLADLIVLQTVAETGGFTAASKVLGRAQSGVSQTVSELEARLGVSLLSRTTRSVRPTAAGQRLLEVARPALARIEESLEQARKGQRELTGKLRLTSLDYPAKALLTPLLKTFMSRYPGVEVDLRISDRKVDIVADGFDAGVRFGRHLEKDMVSLPLGGDVRSIVVGSPDYFAERGRPVVPTDLANHTCINYRIAAETGHRYRWLFANDGRAIEMSVPGRLAVDDGPTIVAAAKAGLGLAYHFEPHVSSELAAGTLEACLTDYCPLWDGYRIYYPDRDRKSPILQALVEQIRDSGVHTG